MKNLSGFRQKMGLTNILIPVFLLFSVIASAKEMPSEESDTVAIQGRWDITINVNGNSVPSWLEIHHSGLKMLVGSFVGPGGSARPVSRINLKDGIMSFSIPPQWEPEPNDLKVEGRFDGDSLAGEMSFSNGHTYSWVGKRAPLLMRGHEPQWGAPVKLFDGKDMNQWHTNGKNQWVVENGILSSPHRGSNLITNRTFNDFKLHVEFRYPKGSNSGVYLRGRYEVQIEDSKGMEASKIVLGAIYGFLAPSKMAAKAAGEWQSFDITLVGRTVTVILNGKKIICDRQIPGITGGAINSNEGAPGPILLQGDHASIDYRNIIITPAK